MNAGLRVIYLSNVYSTCIETDCFCLHHHPFFLSVPTGTKVSFIRNDVQNASTRPDETVNDSRNL